MKWSYGLTTVPSRFDALLPRTLGSLARGGFADPRLFIDGDCPIPATLTKYSITHRVPAVKTFASWILSAWELYFREPNADRYAVFQDDFVTYRNLRRYLECCEYPKTGYLNLYTYDFNEGAKGWHLSDQNGRGGVALVFNNEALCKLLSHPLIAQHPKSVRGCSRLDGVVVDALKDLKWQEWVHSPSLVQHTGRLSSMGHGVHAESVSFMGEEFDAMSLLCSET